jgi:hypothetical protein
VKLTDGHQNERIKGLYELKGLVFEKRRLLSVINEIIPDTELLSFIRSGGVELLSPVQGIPYDGRDVVASLVTEGASLILELEPDNPYDPYAVRVLFDNKQIGYVQRDKAKILSREMNLGRGARAYARTVRPATTEYPFPWIIMTIQLA